MWKDGEREEKMVAVSTVGTSTGKELESEYFELRSSRQWEFVRNVLEMKKVKMMFLKLQTKLSNRWTASCGNGGSPFITMSATWLVLETKEAPKPQMPHNPPGVKS